jgi:hypothetical protein
MPFKPRLGLSCLAKWAIGDTEQQIKETNGSKGSSKAAGLSYVYMYTPYFVVHNITDTSVQFTCLTVALPGVPPIGGF